MVSELAEQHAKGTARVVSSSHSVDVLAPGVSKLAVVKAVRERCRMTAARQEAILKSAANNLWDQIPRRARHGRRVRDLLEAIGAFARAYTLQPNAPNDPGVNGVAISMRDRERLLDPSYLEKHPKHAQLAELLASALAQNLLDATLDYKCKGQKWMVLNLNRLLCVRYRLPLHYGKFKEKTLAELTRWAEDGFKPPRSGAELV